MEVGAEVCAVGSRLGRGWTLEDQGMSSLYHWLKHRPPWSSFSSTTMSTVWINWKNTNISWNFRSESEIQWGSEGLRSMLSSVEAQGFSFASFLVPRSQESVWYLEAAGLSLPPSSPQTNATFCLAFRHCFASNEYWDFFRMSSLLYYIWVTINIYQHVFPHSLHQPARQAKRYVELVLIARGASKAVEDRGHFGHRGWINKDPSEGNHITIVNYDMT